MIELTYLYLGIIACCFCSYFWVESGERLKSFRTDWYYYIVILCFWPFFLVAVFLGLLEGNNK